MPLPSFVRRPPSWPLVAAPLLPVATVLRMGLFGNPLYGDDEPFYLLFAHRLLHGDVPYVDIWDRKPFGLFLIFVALRWICGAGVPAPQISQYRSEGRRVTLNSLMERRSNFHKISPIRI